jgi:hypothetical protein
MEKVIAGLPGTVIADSPLRHIDDDGWWFNEESRILGLGLRPLFIPYSYPQSVVKEAWTE